MKNVLKLKYPASWWGSKWREALPAGNGTTGAAVYGGVYEETVMLTHEDLWWSSKTPEIPDISYTLQDVRRLLLENKAKEADRIMEAAFEEKRYYPDLASPLPLGDLKLFMPCGNAFKNYNRSLDMSTGVINVTWKDGETLYGRELFVSRTHDMVVCRIYRDGNDLIELKALLDLHDRSDARIPDELRLAELPGNLEAFCSDGYIYYAATNEDGKDFGAVAKVIAENGIMVSDVGNIRVKGADSVIIYVKVFVKGSRRQEWSKLKAELDAEGLDYPVLKENHAKEHGRLFQAMTFDLNAEGRQRSNEELLLEAYEGQAGDALVEKMWAYGRYLLISSSAGGKNPCPLMGLWCGEYIGLWANNMANENLQMIYWQALSGNMPQLLLPVFDYYERMLEDFRINARRIFGARGIYIPADSAPDSGLLKDTQPHIIHWTGGAGWIAQHYYDYYLHTCDEEFLRRRAMPFLREVALFYEDFLVMGEDGYYMSLPGVSPENTPGNYCNGDPAGAYMETTINPTMDIAIAREVFTHLIEGVRKTGMYNEEAEKWESILKHLPPYQVNDDGAAREWLHPFFEDNYHHRHQSHIYPVFPGTEITRRNNPELFEAFVTAVKKRLIIGLKEQSGWSLAHMANIYARMGEGDLALECLDILSRSCVINNFFTFHNDWRCMGIGVDMDWAPFQIDANMGWTSAVQEMLLFTLPGSISILPALPGRWKKGEAGPMLAKGGIEVKVAWDCTEGWAEVELESKKQDQTVELIFASEIHTAEGFNADGPKNGTVRLNVNEKKKLKVVFKEA